MGIKTVYHGSTNKIIRPDNNFSEGDGQSAYGRGFYVAVEKDYAMEHLNKRLKGLSSTSAGGAVYEMDIQLEEKNILDQLSKRYPANYMNRFILGAEKSGHYELATDLKNLQSAMTAKNNSYKSEKIAQPIYLRDGTIGGSDITGLIEGHLGQKQSTNVIINSGIDALSFPNNQYSMYTIVNLDIIQGELRENEIIGNGPIEVYRPRNDGHDLVERKEFMSDQLHSSALNVYASKNRDLSVAFDNLAIHLLGDKYNKTGLPLNENHGPKLDFGKQFRDGIGIATNRILDDKGQTDNEDDYSGTSTWTRRKQEILQWAGDDPILVKKLQAYENALFDHVENKYGLRPNPTPANNPHISTLPEKIEFSSSDKKIGFKRAVSEPPSGNKLSYGPVNN